MKLHEVIKAKYLGDYRLSLTFDNRKKGEVDLKDRLWGEVFLPLKNKEYFKKFKVDSDLGTISWPNGADIAPETLYRDAIEAVERNKEKK